MTSSTNVDLVRSLRAAWERGDFSSAEWAHPEIEYVIADGPEPGSWIGVGAMAEGFRSFLVAWQGYRVEAEEYRELDDERVIVLFRYGGRGKVSGLDLGRLGMKGVAVFHLREGKGQKGRSLLGRRSRARRPRPLPGGRRTMTDSANVDLVRSIYAAHERGDFRSTEWAHPEIEYVQADGPSPGRWIGVAAMAANFGEWLSAWEQLSIKAARYREIDGERVLVFDRFGGRGKTSGVEVERLRGKGANLFHIPR